jgi:phage FluMu protein Com
MKFLVRCEKCGRLLGIFERAVGEIICPKCKHIKKVDLNIEGEVTMTQKIKMPDTARENILDEIDDTRSEAQLKAYRMETLIKICYASSSDHTPDIEWPMVFSLLESEIKGVIEELNKIDRLCYKRQLT